MKISIITVCFNSATTISDTLRSVAEQTHADIEHIVVDGASADQTLAVVRANASDKLKLISEPDQGIYDAMNKGIAAASGEFVGFLNGDDVFAHASSVSDLVAAVRSADTDAVYADLVYVRAEDTNAVVRLWRSGKFSASRLRFGWMPPHPTFYVRRELLQQIGGFDASMRIAADYDLMLRVLSRPGIRVAYVGSVLVKMRLGGASNQTLKGILRKSREDLRALRRSRVGGWPALICKNLRKLPQFITR